MVFFCFFWPFFCFGVLRGYFGFLCFLGARLWRESLGAGLLQALWPGYGVDILGVSNTGRASVAGGQGARHSNKRSIRVIRTNVRNTCSTVFLSQSVRISYRILEIFNRIRNFFNRILTEFLLIFQPNLGLVCCLVWHYKIDARQLVGYKGH